MKSIFKIAILLLLFGCHRYTIILFDYSTKNDFITIEEEDIIYFFDKNDMISAYLTYFNTLPFDKQRYIDSIVLERIKWRTSVPFSNSDTTLSNVTSCYSLYETKYQMLKEGKCKIYNKKDNKFEKKMICKSEKGLYGQRNDVFILTNGKRFFSYITTYGE